MNRHKTSRVTVMLHYPGKLPYGTEGFSRILDSVINQKLLPDELIILNQNPEEQVNFDIESVDTKVIRGDYDNLSQWLNAGLDQASGDYVVYLDNQTAEITLKLSYLEIALLTVKRKPNLGMLYADYELQENKDIQENHLLKHHRGRVRDNQDYGRVLFFRKSALEKAGGFDETVEYNTLYDMRLKISENYDLVHIANRYAGSLYRVVAAGKKANVFDYLMASKASQEEAERVVSEHLKRIKAYLPPGKFYQKRSVTQAELTATVIIPVNNRPEFMEAALSSVFNQTVQDIEAIVVVNGGPQDPTIKEVKRFMAGGDKYDQEKPEVRLIMTDINNIGLCLNLGVEAARGKYYVQLDSDDRLKANAVEKVVATFNSDEKIGMVIGSYEVWEKKENGQYMRKEDIPVVTHGEWTEENGRNNLLRINGAGAPRCIPIHIIKEVGYFGMNEAPYTRNYGEDYDMVMRISEKYRVGRIYDPIYEVVRHAGGTDHAIDQITVDRNDEAKDYMRLEAIQRRIGMNAVK